MMTKTEIQNFKINQYEIITKTETYKKLNANKPMSEIREQAWELTGYYDQIRKEADKNERENPIPDVNDEQFDEKLINHRKAMDYCSICNKIYFAVSRYTCGQRRSQKMGYELYEALYEAIINGVEVL